MSNYTSRGVKQGGRRFRKRKDRTIARTRKDINQDRRLVRLEKSVKQIRTSIDLKYHDVQAAGQIIDTDGVGFLLNGVALGLADNLRIGDKIKITSLQWRCIFQANGADVGEPNMVRMIIVKDRQSNNDGIIPKGSPTTGPNGTALLNDTIITQNMLLPYTHEALMRFKILYDKVIVLNPNVLHSSSEGSATAVIPTTVYRSGYVRLNTTVKYTGTGSATGDIATNSLSVWFLSNNSTNSPTIDWGSRIYYRDA